MHPLVLSLGCPCGIGPEVTARALAQLTSPHVVVGDLGALTDAAALVGAKARRFVPFDGTFGDAETTPVLQPSSALTRAEREWGRPGAAAGAAQLRWVEVAYDLAKEHRGAIVTGPVSKAVVASSGVPGAERFLGHTEWLEARDGAPYSTMCFASEQLVTSLVTTHLPLARVPEALTPRGVANATVELVRLLTALEHPRPRVAVVSLNPHAGEGELLGDEENRAIVPGIELARAELARAELVAELVGPVGAETAYRKTRTGHYEGVVAMYHDQATIPMKLLAFGEAVNVTMGLSVVRTSVDHGTGYDIAGRGVASSRGLVSALELARRLLAARA